MSGGQLEALFYYVFPPFVDIYRYLPVAVYWSLLGLYARDFGRRQLLAFSCTWVALLVVFLVVGVPAVYFFVVQTALATTMMAVVAVRFGARGWR